MATAVTQPLPADLLHLIFAELATQAEARERAEEAQPEFAALCNCVLSSKYLATAGAITALYRICLGDKSPVKGGGSDNVSFAEQDVTVMRWSVLWRTIILSALGKTLYPYCRHLRALDLRDLSDLLERLDEPKFKTKVAKKFFEGDLARFHIFGSQIVKTRAARLDSKKILLAIGDEITKQAPLLETLSEPTTLDVLSGALPTWTPRLSHLRELEFWDGKLLADDTVRNLLHVHCPALESLRLYTSTDSEADQHLAAFISGMQPNTLKRFENNSSCRIGPETCLALNAHGESLHTLRLALEEDGMLALGLLQSCTMISELAIHAQRQSVDLKATQNDVYLEIVEWLKRCDRLHKVEFEEFISAPDLLLPVLLNKNANVRTLWIKAKGENAMYTVRQHHEFHRALGQHSSLTDLTIQADSDGMTRDDIDVLMESICNLKSLTDLDLRRTSDYFTDPQVKLLAESLPRLSDFNIGGYGVSDGVWDSVAKLRHLTHLTFAGFTTFTVDGLLNFIAKLGDGNRTLHLSVDLADTDTMIQEDGQELIRQAIAAKLEGRFDYMPIRDPNMPEFEGSDSD